MTSHELRCWNCGESLKEVPRPISRHEQCPHCFEALHCCRLCRHYRADVTGRCEEDRADPPVIKENANFCDWFRPDSEAFSGAGVGKSVAAQDRLDALFGGPDTQADEDDTGVPPADPSSEDVAKSKLDDLFAKD